MKRANPTILKLLEISEPVVSGAGYELVDLEYRREQVGWVVRVFIDHPDGISFDDCERVSRELGPVLDVNDPVPGAYSLEVSSPGVNRPLRTAAHFRDHAGETVKVVLHQGLDGRRNFRGTVVGVSDSAEQAIVDVDGTEFSLPIDDIEMARLVPDWDGLMPGQGNKRNRKTR